MIDLAIEVAVRAHQNQFRKGTDIPYITHPLAVGIMLAKAGCSDEVIEFLEKQAQAALEVE